MVSLTKKMQPKVNKNPYVDLSADSTKKGGWAKAQTTSQPGDEGFVEGCVLKKGKNEHWSDQGDT